MRQASSERDCHSVCPSLCPYVTLFYVFAKCTLVTSSCISWRITQPCGLVDIQIEFIMHFTVWKLTRITIILGEGCIWARWCRNLCQLLKWRRIAKSVKNHTKWCCWVRQHHYCDVYYCDLIIRAFDYLVNGGGGVGIKSTLDFSFL